MKMIYGYIFLKKTLRVFLELEKIYRCWVVICVVQKVAHSLNSIRVRNVHGDEGPIKVRRWCGDSATGPTSAVARGEPEEVRLDVAGGWVRALKKVVIFSALA